MSSPQTAVINDKRNLATHFLNKNLQDENSRHSMMQQNIEETYKTAILFCLWWVLLIPLDQINIQF